MGFGEPKMPTPEEMAKIQKERALSDAELIKGGAEYVPNKNGIRLHVTDEQLDGFKFENYNEAEKNIINVHSQMEEVFKKLRDSNLNEIKAELQRDLLLIKLNVDDIIARNYSADKQREFKNAGFSRHDKLGDKVINWSDDIIRYTPEEIKHWWDEERDSSTTFKK